MDKEKKVSRRVVLRGAAIAAGAIPVLLSAINAAYAKVKQEQVHYQLEPKDGQQCSKCTNFEAPSACKLVEGEINPNGYCQLFKAIKQ